MQSVFAVFKVALRVAFACGSTALVAISVYLLILWLFRAH